jgi:Rrf2 family protein
MNSGRFSVSLHILTLLTRAEGQLLSSGEMAGSINIHPVLVRRELMNLRKHHFAASIEGKNGGSYLSKPAGEIFLSDVYKAVKQTDLLSKSKNKPNPHCAVGKQINKHLDELYDDAEKALLKRLEKVTLKKFAKQFNV